MSKRNSGAKKSLHIALLLAGIVIAIIVATLIATAGQNVPAPTLDLNPDASASGGIGPSASPTATPEPTPTPVLYPSPTSVAQTDPDAFGLITEMQLDGASITDYVSSYRTSFGTPDEFTSVEGVTTFRGNNFRDDATYGTAGSVEDKTLNLVWTADIPGSIAKGTGSGTWFGCGWTGQPLIVRWDEDVKQVMNLYDSAMATQDFTEVIYATENSNIYFLDLYTGAFTRDEIDGGFTFKGSGSIDPRGYPLLYVGAGDSGPNGAARNFIFSLIDGSVLYEYGANDDFSLRNFKGFDAATLVHAESDSVTYPSETGIIYRFRLNTQFDMEAGTISVNPSDMLKWRYTTERTRQGGTGSYWLGMETSLIMWENYMYFADNAGNMFCMDSSTMEVIWMQDVLDDTNCTPVFELNEELGEAYIYVGTSSHWTADSNEIADIPFWKLNAITGEIIWQDEGYRCTRTNVSGGVQASPALGKNNLSDLIFVSYALTVDTDTRGTLVAYDKLTHEKVWVKNLRGYSYSSPIVMYDDDGDGYVVTCDSTGHMYLFDGRTGETLDSLELEGNFEASPAAFGNMIVIGTRSSKIYGVRLG
ncbi:MAG: PQQ-binding-like beta-propeller repeat protein [Clostridia bacterium]|nr:PQQ-binding-like beta-propeller repeat protein [Clostridia bacterium]